MVVHVITAWGGVTIMISLHQGRVGSLSEEGGACHSSARVVSLFVALTSLEAQCPTCEGMGGNCRVFLIGLRI